MKTKSTPARWRAYSSEGLGIVRLDGAVVFVPRAVRGETIDLKITKVMKTAAAGEIVKIHKPSPGPGGAGVPLLRPVRRVRLPAPDLPGGAAGQAPAGPGRPDPPGGRGHPGGGDPGGQEPPPLPQQEPVPRGGRRRHRLLPGPVPPGGAGEAVPDPARGGGQNRRGGGGVDAALQDPRL